MSFREWWILKEGDEDHIYLFKPHFEHEYLNHVVQHSVAKNLYTALAKLRASQKAYMADRGNNELGKIVADMAQEADEELKRYEGL